jgi:hypothetical protein
MEEAAFMNEEMFAKIIVPLLGVDKTAMLAISTPDDETNYYTVLMEVKGPNDKPLFKIIKIGMACESCEASGIPCSHKIYRLPFWKPIARQEKLDAIYKDRPELFAREILGQVVSSKEYILDGNMIRSLRERPLYKFNNPTFVVHIGIDPSGGASASDYAISSVVYDNGNAVIVGNDASGSHKHNDILAMMDGHMMKLRSYATYANALFVVYFEANMSFITADAFKNHFEAHQQTLGNVWVVSRDPKNKGRIGVWTGETEKELYASTLKRNMANNKLYYAENFVSVIKATKNSKQDLEEQMKHLRKEVKQNQLNPGFDKVHVTYTGKGNGVRDDSCMALQIALYHMELSRQDPQFITRCTTQCMR